MVKTAGGFELALPKRERGVAIGRWLYGALREAILRGQLRPGARLPSTRELAARYRVSRGTVVGVYEELASEGYLDATIGAGTRVHTVLPDNLFETNAAKPSTIVAPVKRPRPAAYAGRLRKFRSLPGPVGRAFRINTPALAEFPTALWAQITARRLRRVSASELAGCPPLGYPPLREAIAEYLSSSRGVPCTSDQVVIVSGVQDALDTIGRLVLEPNDRAAVEEPGYPGARALLHALGARVVSVPVDAEGLVLDARRLKDVRLVYVTPAHQAPLGMAMSLSRRLALLAWARRTGALVFEDDYDSEYRYAAEPIPALEGLDRFGHVVFAGSFSKTLFPSLRLGYLVVPPDFVERCEAARSLVQRHPPMIEQMIVAEFMSEGHFARHLRRMRQLYAERLGVLFEHSEHELAGLLELSPIEAGLQTIGWLAPGISGEDAEAAARTQGVQVMPLSRYYRGPPPRDGLQLGFASTPVREIRRGVEQLARALAGRARK